VQARRFILVNFADRPEYAEYNGKCVALDIDDRHAPFPALFLIHEMRVRGFHPFWDTPNIDITTLHDQAWMISDGVRNTAGKFIKLEPPSSASHTALTASTSVTSTGLQASGTSAGFQGISKNTLDAILEATRQSASWKSCVLEGQDWSGTAEENTKVYLSLHDDTSPQSP
jgi:hypothetical protein